MIKNIFLCVGQVLLYVVVEAPLKRFTPDPAQPLGDTDWIS